MTHGFPDPPQLTDDIVHVISCRLDDATSRAVDILADGERQRAARFVSDADRRRYISAHAQLRMVLGRCLGRRAQSLRFARGTYGKPYVADGDNPHDVRFNMSHSGDRALIAVTLGREVGVDIEEEKGIGNPLAVAQHFFAPGERSVMAGLPEAARCAAFFRCWTRKEAVIKALGAGLSCSLDGFEVPLDEDAPPRCRRLAVGGVDWQLASVPVGTPYTAALAAPVGDWRIELWDATTHGVPPPVVHRW